MNIQERQQKYLASIYDLDKETALSKLNAFLEENGIKEPKRYFLEWITIQGDNVSTTYIEFAEVPEELESKKGINVGKIGEGQDLILRANKDEYDSYKMGESNSEINSFLKERKLRKDNLYIFPFIEMDGDDYVIHIPVK